MDILLEQNKNLLSELGKSGIEFLLVGGYAVNYHGYSRYTGDMDLWIKPTNNNRDKLLDLLIKLGFDETRINQLRKVDFTVPYVFSIWETPFKTDFITHLNVISFDKAYENKVIAVLEGVTVPIVHLNDLVISKLTSDRLKDKLDVEELQKVQKYIKK